MTYMSRWMGVVLVMSLVARPGMAQDVPRDADRLRVEISRVVFDSLSEARASVSPEARAVISSAIDQAIEAAAREDLPRDWDPAIAASRRWAGELIKGGRQPDGSIRLGERTPAIVTGICPLWPFC